MKRLGKRQDTWDWHSEEMSHKERVCRPVGGQVSWEHVERRGGLTPIPEGPTHLEARQIRSQQKRHNQYFKRRPLIRCVWQHETGSWFPLGCGPAICPWAKYLSSHCEPEVVVPEGGGGWRSRVCTDGASSTQTVPAVSRTPAQPLHREHWPPPGYRDFPAL